MAIIRLSGFGGALGPLTTSLLLACGHTDPFGAPVLPTAGPFSPGFPAQLTLNPMQDLAPAFLPDGSAVVYTFETSPAELWDRCLGVLPAGGGTRSREICARSAGSLDSLDALTGAAVSPGGRLAYVYAQSLPGAVNPNRSALMVTDFAPPEAPRAVLSFPTNLAGHKIDGASHIRWLSETRLVFLALRIDYPRPAPLAPPDTLPTGVAVALIDLVNAPGQAVLLEATESATSVDVSGEPETLYFTRAGDGSVFRLDVASGEATTAINLGAFGIARDVAVRGDRMVAVAGGAVSFEDDPVLGRIQRDRGGPLVLADLENGETQQLPGSEPGEGQLFFRRPSMSPDGAIVAEGYSVTQSPGGQAVSPIGDLWSYISLFDSP